MSGKWHGSFTKRIIGPADSLNPAQLQRTAWFYLGLFFGRREREKQR